MDSYKNFTANLSNFLKVISPNEEKLYTLETIKDLSEKRHNYYSEIEIPKKSGGKRTLHASEGDLKLVQEKILDLLQLVYHDKSAPSCVCGFVKGRSIVDNAEKHTGKNFVINVDIKDFFSSISFEKVNIYLSNSPFSLHRRSWMNVIITTISTRNGVLPQGAPTSPILSNIVLKNLDYALVMFARKNNVVYSRYADDLTFSGNNNIDYHSFINTISQKLNKHGFLINKSKSRIQYSWQRQLVTGLVVNHKVNVKSEYLATTKSMLYNWKKDGLDKAKSEFNAGRRPGDGIHFENVLRGRIDFIGSVLNRNKNYKHSTYLELNSKYWVLLNCIDYSFISDHQVKTKLFNRNFECEKIALDKSMYEDQEYRFVSYCFTVYTQMELLYKYYFYLRFNKDFKKIGLFLFENSKFISKQFQKMVQEFDDDQDKINKARTKAMNIPNLKMISTFSVEDVFMNELFNRRRRAFPKFFNFVREIRNYHAHAGDSIVKQTFEEVKQDVDIIIESRNLAEININSKPFKGISGPEQKKINHYQFYLWFQSSPFDDVRRILNEIAYEIKVLEINKAKKMHII